MNTGLGIYQLLQESSDVTDLVGTRVFPALAAQQAEMPFITYELVQITPSDEKDGPSTMDEVRVEVVCYAEKYSVAADLGTKVRTALDRMALQGDGISIQSIKFHDVTDEVLDSPRRYLQVHDYTVRQNRDNEASVYLGRPVTVTDGDGTEVEVQAGGSYTCIAVAPPISGLPVSAGIVYQRQIPWQGYDTSGDEGAVEWHRAAGTYNYTPPQNITGAALLADGYTGTDAAALLAQENAFGNYYRYTNDQGQQFTEGFDVSSENSSTNKTYCIDHLTGLGMYVWTAYDRQGWTWAEAIAHSNSFTHAGFSDWRLADISEYLAILNFSDWQNAWNGAYTPWMNPNVRNYGGSMWLGCRDNDGNFLRFRTNGPTIDRSNSTSTCDHSLLVRNHYT
jgi:hypothetical protein